MLKLALIAICFVGLGRAIYEDEIVNQWKEFHETHKKTYKSPIELQKRFIIFKNNLEIIERHNVLYEKGETGYKMGVNVFTDWTDEEIEEYFGEIVENFDEGGYLEVFKSNPNFTAPESFDWREKGVVATPQNQKECSASWAFAAAGALEAAQAIKTGNLIPYSKQNLIDCCKEPKYDGKGCKGGGVIPSFQYVKDHGIQKEDAYPKYTATNDYCRQKGSDLEIKGHVPLEHLEIAIQEAVATEGPVATAIYAPKSFAKYTSGIYNDPECSGQKGNLMILIVGYGTENDTPYWIVKNSWGAEWGEGGFFRLKRGVGACGMLRSTPTYPVL